MEVLSTVRSIYARGSALSKDRGTLRPFSCLMGLKPSFNSQKEIEGKKKD